MLNSNEISETMLKGLAGVDEIVRLSGGFAALVASLPFLTCKAVGAGVLFIMHRFIHAYIYIYIYIYIHISWECSRLERDPSISLSLSIYKWASMCVFKRVLVYVC